MKAYTITVNGNSYEVTVEEKGVTSNASAPTPVKAAPAPKAAAVSGAQGAINVNSPVPGKIFKIEASVGVSVKKGENILVLESMKMEIPVVAPQDGTISSINVSQGDAIESGDLLATMN